MLFLKLAVFGLVASLLMELFIYYASKKKALNPIEIINIREHLHIQHHSFSFISHLLHLLLGSFFASLYFLAIVFYTKTPGSKDLFILPFILSIFQGLVFTFILALFQNFYPTEKINIFKNSTIYFFSHITYGLTLGLLFLFFIPTDEFFPIYTSPFAQITSLLSITFFYSVFGALFLIPLAFKFKTSKHNELRR